MLLNISGMHYSFSFTSQKIIRFLSVLLFVLLVANIAATYFKWVKGLETALGIIPLFDFDGEFNLPSLFSFGLITSNALILFLIAKHSAVSQQERNYWSLLRYVFLFLAFDELMSIHERVGLILYSKMPNAFFLSDSRFWILPMSILLLLFAVYFFRFFWNLPPQLRLRFLLAGLVYLGGAIGVETLGDIYMWYHDKPDFYYGLLSSLEELMEMVGMILFLHALLQHLQRLSQTQNFSLNFLVGDSKRK